MVCPRESQILKYRTRFKCFGLFCIFFKCIFAAAMSKENTQKSLHLFEGWAFSKKNYLIFFVGILFIVFGYIVMATGEVNSFQSLTVAPVMLFLGYIVIIPLALIYRDKSKEQNLGS